MAYLEQKLQARLSQKLIITPQLQQAIKLLQLSKLDLQQEISHELVNNPALEEAGTTLEQGSESTANEAASQSSEREVTAGEDADRRDDDFDYASFFRDLEDSYQPTRGVAEQRPIEDLPSVEQFVRSRGHLSDHLSWQLEMSALSPRHQAIGEALIGNLDEKGYLEASLEEIAGMSPDEKQPWTVEEVTEVKRTIQHFDPVGVCSSDLHDCLRVQLDVAGMGDTIAATAISEHFDLLENRKLGELKRVLGIDDEQLDALLELIRHLDPRPGEKYNPEPTTYITPDVYVVKDGDDYRIVLNDEGLPRLRVSPTYRKFFREGKDGQASDRNAQEFVKEKVKAAFRLIRSLEERQRTIHKVASAIVKFQRPFLDKGIEEIKPLVLRDVAEEIGMHESTVSRVVNHKYMHTHRGLFEMRFFFHSGLSSSEGDAISSLTVKNKIKKMVSEESPTKPMSDQAIAEALREDGLKIARRTVAKYREELRIPPSTQRRQRR